MTKTPLTVGDLISELLKIDPDTIVLGAEELRERAPKEYEPYTVGLYTVLREANNPYLIPSLGEGIRDENGRYLIDTENWL